jgi:transcriptional regulator with XRE-family HTH domain
MKTLGQFLIERRKAQGLSQKEFAALIKNRDGKPISATYLNYLEHDRGKPPDYLLDLSVSNSNSGGDWGLK